MSIHQATQPATATMTKPGVGAAIASEFLKLFSLPSQRIIIALAIGLAPLVAAVLFFSLPVTEGTPVSELPNSEILSVAILGVDAAAFMIIILAALHVGSEYSAGMMESTLTVTPSRGNILTGKFISIGVTALLVGIIAAILSVGFAWLMVVTVSDEPGQLLTSAGIQLALGSIAMPVLYALIAAAGAFVFRSTAMGIVVALGIMVVGSLTSWFGESVSALITPLMPTAAIHSLSGVASGHESIGMVGAIISIVVWASLSIAAAAWRLLQHDA